MKTIIAPTDFSTISINAVNYAADLACVIGTNLSVIHVCQPPLSFSEVPPYNITESIKDAEKQMEKVKDDLMHRTGQRIAINTEVRTGDIVSEINEHCTSVNTYAVVMGAESGSGFERFMFGGKTITAIKQLTYPLIVVPPDIEFSDIKKIGLACDLKYVAETIPAVEIKNLLDVFHAELHVLHVRTDISKSFTDKKIMEAEWLRDILADLNPKYHFITGKDIEKEISDFAEENEIDLLVIIPKKHDWIDKIFHHSHSKRFVLQTHIPLMAIHA
jgi:nucleotide-binding universal stress UspA family protein